MDNKWEMKKTLDSIPELTDEELSQMETEELGNYLELLQTKDEFKKHNKLLYFRADKWLDKLSDKMEDEIVCSIIASNRSGKSYSTTWLLACHLTGIYPDWYTGLKYEDAIDTWIMSPTSENYVQAGGLQEYLLGKDDSLGTGWLPKDCIVDTKIGMGTRGFIKKVSVRHVSGGISTVEYKSYSQGQGVLMGGNVDLILIDEEPKDTKIVGQCATRIQRCNSGKGRLLLCFTPEQGMTEVVERCFEGIWKDGNVRITVWDVSFISEEDIENMYKSIPEREQDMRMKGIPAIGRGAVFPQQEFEIKFYSEDVKIEPHWKVAAAIDFGYLPDPCAVLFGAFNPDIGRYYVFEEFYETEKQVTEIAAWIKYKAPTIPVIYPADGNKKQQAADGLTYQQMFMKEGVNMPESNRVRYGKDGERETGHTTLRTLFNQKQLMISDKCTNWFKEFRVYQYDEKGSTNHCPDHAMDALRYLIQRIDEVGISWADAQTHIRPQYRRSQAPKTRRIQQY